MRVNVKEIRKSKEVNVVAFAALVIRLEGKDTSKIFAECQDAILKTPGVKGIIYRRISNDKLYITSYKPKELRNKEILEG